MLSQSVLIVFFAKVTMSIAVIILEYKSIMITLIFIHVLYTQKFLFPYKNRVIGCRVSLPVIKTIHHVLYFEKN